MIAYVIITKISSIEDDLNHVLQNYPKRLMIRITETKDWEHNAIHGSGRFKIAPDRIFLSNKNT